MTGRNIRPVADKPLPVVNFREEELDGKEDCPDCDGVGYITTDCSRCEGDGCDDDGEPCHTCGGFGTEDDDCETCGGTGLVDADDD